MLVIYVQAEQILHKCRLVLFYCPGNFSHFLLFRMNEGVEMCPDIFCEPFCVRNSFFYVTCVLKYYYLVPK